MENQVSFIDGYKYEPPTEAEVKSNAHRYLKPQEQYGLANNGKHCKDCKFLMYRDYNWKKCAKWKDTSSSATDVRMKWDACKLFENVEET